MGCEETSGNSSIATGWLVAEAALLLVDWWCRGESFSEAAIILTLQQQYTIEELPEPKFKQRIRVILPILF